MPKPDFAWVNKKKNSLPALSFFSRALYFGGNWKGYSVLLFSNLKLHLPYQNAK
jgi:hypothetical protein